MEAPVTDRRPTRRGFLRGLLAGAMLATAPLLRVPERTALEQLADACADVPPVGLIEEEAMRQTYAFKYFLNASPRKSMTASTLESLELQLGS